MLRMRFLLVLLFSTLVCLGDDRTHRYVEDEELDLYVNQVGPYANPHETFPYYSLPFCQPEEMIHRGEDLGEALQGYDLIKSPVTMIWGADKETTPLCSVELTDEKFSAFQEAVSRQYWFQLFLDDLPMWAMVGGTPDDEGAEDPELFVYLHMRFDVGYNADRLVEVNLTNERPVRLVKGEKLDFSYSINWIASDIEYYARFDRYLDDDFFEHEVHWFSVLNSFMMLLFLVALVTVILIRTLRRDLSRIGSLEEGQVGREDSGWKQLSGDVFRKPENLQALSAFIGVGWHLTFMSLSVIIFAFFADLHQERGSLASTGLTLYALCSAIGGYMSGSFYSRHGGQEWIKTSLITATMFPTIVFLIALPLDMMAMNAHSLSSVPLGTLFSLVALWIFVTIPLTFAGTMLGRNEEKESFPTKVNAVPRVIPASPWYLQDPFTTLQGGMLPFGSIFIEMYFVFTAFWHYKYYYVYGFLGVIFVILMIVCLCVTVVTTYFLLNRENHQWWWPAFTAPASTGVYVYAYSAYYFLFRTEMHGTLQTAFFFGYMLIISIALAFICGAIGFTGASYFVVAIYRSSKQD